MKPDVYRVRASSWGQLFNCAHAWEGVHLLGMQSANSPRAHLGTAIHAGTGEYDLASLNDKPISVYESAEIFVNALRNPEYEVDWSGSDLTLNDAEKIGVTLTALYCDKIAPLYSFVAVELPTKPLIIDCGGGIQIQLTGTIDRVFTDDSGHSIGIADLKTGGASIADGIVKTSAHRAQIGTYELLCEHTMERRCDLPANIMALKTKGDAEYGTGEIIGARDLMIGTEEYPGLIQIGADMFRAGLFPPNPQSFTCSEQYCPRWSQCKYK